MAATRPKGSNNDGIKEGSAFSEWQRKTVPTYHISCDSLDGAGRRIMLQDVVDRVPPYARVVLGGGQYAEQLNINKPVEVVAEAGEEAVISSRGPCVVVLADVAAYFAGVKIRIKLPPGAADKVAQSQQQAVAIASGGNMAGVPTAFLPQQAALANARVDPPAVLVNAGKPVFFKCELTSIQVCGSAEPVVENCSVVGNLGGSGILIRDAAGGQYLCNDIADHARYCIEIATRGNPVFSKNDVHAKHDDITARPGLGLLKISGASAAKAATGPDSLSMSLLSGPAKARAQSMAEGSLGSGVCATFDTNRFHDIFSEQQQAMGAAIITGGIKGPGGQAQQPAKKVITGGDICAQRAVVKVENANVALKNNTVEGGVVGVCITGLGSTMSGNTVSGSILCGLYLGPQTTATAVEDTYASHRSGGIFMDSSQSLLTSCTVRTCKGPAITVNHCEDFALEKCTIDRNRGGIFCVGDTSGGVTGCTFTGNELLGLRVTGPSCAPRISDCNFVHNGSVGISCQKGASPVISNNVFQSHAVAAVASEHSSNPKVFDNQIKQNEKYGILIEHSGRGIFSQNTITGSSSGVRVQDGGNPRVTTCTISECAIGIDTCSGAVGTYEDCEIRQNTTGVHISSFADPVFSKNRIHSNTRFGALISADGIGTLIFNKMAHNNIGFVVAEGAFPVLRANLITESGSVGGSLGGGSRALVERNTFQENKGGGLQLTGALCSSSVVANSFLRNNGPGVVSEKGAKGEVVRNLFDGNTEGGYGTLEGGETFFASNQSQNDRGPALFAKKNGAGTFENNHVVSCQNTGLLLESGGAPTVRSCTFEQCLLGGVTVGNGAAGSVTLCQLRGNHKGGLVITGKSTTSLAKLTIQGNAEVGVLLCEGAAAMVADCTITGQPLGIKALSSGPATIQRCTIADNGTGALALGGGEATIEECSFTSSRAAHAEMADNGHATFIACIFGPTERTSILCRTRGAGRFQHCSVKGAGEYGVLLSSGCTTVIEGCDVAECLVGVAGKDKGGGKVLKTRIAHNHMNNVEMSGAATTLLQECDIEECYVGSGVVCLGDACILAGNNIRFNRQYGICAGSGSLVSVLGGNQIHHNRRAGILFAELASGKVTGKNHIFSNIEGGIALAVDASPTITDNKIRDNYNGGIVCYHSSRGKIEQNQITNNDVCNVRLMACSVTHVVNNTISASRCTGIVVEGAAATVEGNEIMKHEQSGVHVIGNSAATLRDNKIHHNGSGVRFEADGRNGLPFPPRPAMGAFAVAADRPRNMDLLDRALQELVEVATTARSRAEALSKQRTVQKGLHKGNGPTTSAGVSRTNSYVGRTQSSTNRPEAQPTLEESMLANTASRGEFRNLRQSIVSMSLGATDVKRVGTRGVKLVNGEILLVAAGAADAAGAGANMLGSVAGSPGSTLRGGSIVRGSPMAPARPVTDLTIGSLDLNSYGDDGGDVEPDVELVASAAEAHDVFLMMARQHSEQAALNPNAIMLNSDTAAAAGGGGGGGEGGAQISAEGGSKGKSNSTASPPAPTKSGLSKRRNKSISTLSSAAAVAAGAATSAGSGNTGTAGTDDYDGVLRAIQARQEASRHASPRPDQDHSNNGHGSAAMSKSASPPPPPAAIGLSATTTAAAARDRVSSAKLLENFLTQNTECGVLFARNTLPILVNNHFEAEAVACKVLAGALGKIERCTFQYCQCGISVEGYSVSTIIIDNTFENNEIGVACRKNGPTEILSAQQRREMVGAGQQDHPFIAVESASPTAPPPVTPQLLSGTQPPLVVTNAMTTIERCAFRNNSGFAVLVADHSTTRVVNNRHDGDTGVSIGLVRAARATVEGNTMRKCCVGVQIASSSDPYLRNNQFIDGTEIGILATGGSGTITQNVFSRCLIAGMLVEQQASPEVYKNLFSRCTQSELSCGIYTRKNGNGLYYDNDIHENAVGIRCDTGGAGVFRQNFVHDQRTFGVFAASGARPTITQCSFSSNGTADVCSEHTGLPIVSRCVFVESTKPILVRHNGGGNFSLNLIRGAAEGAPAVAIQFPPRMNTTTQTVVMSKTFNAVFRSLTGIGDGGGSTFLDTGARPTLSDELTASPVAPVMLVPLHPSVALQMLQRRASLHVAQTAASRRQSTLGGPSHRASIAASFDGSSAGSSPKNAAAAAAQDPGAFTVPVPQICTAHFHRNLVVGCSVAFEVDCGGENSLNVALLHEQWNLKYNVAAAGSDGHGGGADSAPLSPKKNGRISSGNANHHANSGTTGASNGSQSSPAVFPDIHSIQRAEYGAIVSENYIMNCTTAFVVDNGPVTAPYFPFSASHLNSALGGGNPALGTGTTTAQFAMSGVFSPDMSGADGDDGGRTADIAPEPFEDDCYVAQFDSNTVLGGEVGAVMRRGGHARLQHNFFVKPQRLGIQISEQGRGEVLENAITESQSNGISIHGEKPPVNPQQLPPSSPPPKDTVPPPACFVNVQGNLVTQCVRNGLVIACGEARVAKNRVTACEIGLYLNPSALGALIGNIVHECKRIGAYVGTTAVQLASNMFYSANDSGAVEIHCDGFRMPVGNIVKNQFSPRYGRAHAAVRILGPFLSKDDKKAAAATSRDDDNSSRPMSGRSRHQGDANGQAFAESAVSEARLLKDVKELLANLKAMHETELPMCSHLGCKRLGVSQVLRAPTPSEGEGEPEPTTPRRGETDMDAIANALKTLSTAKAALSNGGPSSRVRVLSASSSQSPLVPTRSANRTAGAGPHQPTIGIRRKGSADGSYAASVAPGGGGDRGGQGQVTQRAKSVFVRAENTTPSTTAGKGLQEKRKSRAVSMAPPTKPPLSPRPAEASSGGRPRGRKRQPKIKSIVNTVNESASSDDDLLGGTASGAKPGSRDGRAAAISGPVHPGGPIMVYDDEGRPVVRMRYGKPEAEEAIVGGAKIQRVSTPPDQQTSRMADAAIESPDKGPKQPPGPRPQDMRFGGKPLSVDRLADMRLDPLTGAGDLSGAPSTTATTTTAGPSPPRLPNPPVQGQAPPPWGGLSAATAGSPPKGDLLQAYDVEAHYMIPTISSKGGFVAPDEDRTEDWHTRLAKSASPRRVPPQQLYGGLPATEGESPYLAFVRYAEGASPNSARNTAGSSPGGNPAAINPMRTFEMPDGRLIQARPFPMMAPRGHMALANAAGAGKLRTAMAAGDVTGKSPLSSPGGSPQGSPRGILDGITGQAARIPNARVSFFSAARNMAAASYKGNNSLAPTSGHPQPPSGSESISAGGAGSSTDNTRDVSDSAAPDDYDMGATDTLRPYVFPTTRDSVSEGVLEGVSIVSRPLHGGVHTATATNASTMAANAALTAAAGGEVPVATMGGHVARHAPTTLKVKALPPHAYQTLSTAATTKTEATSSIQPQLSRTVGPDRELSVDGSAVLPPQVTAAKNPCGEDADDRADFHEEADYDGREHTSGPPDHEVPGGFYWVPDPDDPEAPPLLLHVPPQHGMSLGPDAAGTGEFILIGDDEAAADAVVTTAATKTSPKATRAAAAEAPSPPQVVLRTAGPLTSASAAPAVEAMHVRGRRVTMPQTDEAQVSPAADVVANNKARMVAPLPGVDEQGRGDGADNDDAATTPLADAPNESPVPSSTPPLVHGSPSRPGTKEGPPRRTPQPPAASRHRETPTRKEPPSSPIANTVSVTTTVTTAAAAGGSGKPQTLIHVDLPVEARRPCSSPRAASATAAQPQRELLPLQHRPQPPSAQLLAPASGTPPHQRPSVLGLAHGNTFATRVAAPPAGLVISARGAHRQSPPPAAGVGEGGTIISPPHAAPTGALDTFLDASYAGGDGGSGTSSPDHNNSPGAVPAGLSHLLTPDGGGAGPARRHPGHPSHGHGRRQRSAFVGDSDGAMQNYSEMVLRLLRMEAHDAQLQLPREAKLRQTLASISAAAASSGTSTSVSGAVSHQANPSHQPMSLVGPAQRGGNTTGNGTVSALPPPASYAHHTGHGYYRNNQDFYGGTGEGYGFYSGGYALLPQAVALAQLERIATYKHNRVEYYVNPTRGVVVTQGGAIRTHHDHSPQQPQQPSATGGAAGEGGSGPVGGSVNLTSPYGYALTSVEVQQLLEAQKAAALAAGHGDNSDAISATYPTATVTDTTEPTSMTDLVVDCRSATRVLGTNASIKGRRGVAPASLATVPTSVLHATTRIETANSNGTAPRDSTIPIGIWTSAARAGLKPAPVAVPPRQQPTPTGTLFRRGATDAFFPRPLDTSRFPPQAVGDGGGAMASMNSAPSVTGGAFSIPPLALSARQVPLLQTELSGTNLRAAAVSSPRVPPALPPMSTT